MSKIKKALITASVFLVIGVSGAIVTGIHMVPRMVNEVHRVEKEISSTTPMEREIFTTSESVSNLDIVSLEKSNINVEIKKSETENVNVKVYEYISEDMEVKSRYDKDSDTVYVEGYKKKFNFFEQRSIKDELTRIYNKIIYTLAEEKNNISEIVVEVPDGVDINFNSEYHGNLTVSDSRVLKDNISFKSIGGELQLPEDNKLKNISIDTTGYIQLDVKEFINAESLRIKGNYVGIVTNANDTDYEKYSRLPQEVSIEASNVSVKTNIPLGDDVKIDADEVEYVGNFQKYPLYCKFYGNMWCEGNFYSDGLGEIYPSKLEFKDYYNGVLGRNERSNHYLRINDYNKCEIKNKSN